MNARVNKYKKEAAKTQLADADPYQVIQMLMAGVLENLAAAKGAIERRDLEAKSKAISKATSIITALRASLDFEVGGELSQNLNALYDYMAERLVDASVENNADIVMEVANLFREIKTAWDAIPVEARIEAEKARASLADAS
jgi:flagellar protein FliS